MPFSNKNQMKIDFKKIITYHILLQKDLHSSWDFLHNRDRAIYLGACKSGVVSEKSASNTLLDLWCQNQEKQLSETEKKLTQSIAGLFSFLHLAILPLLFILGFSTMFSFLSYGGTKAINVFSFLLLFIVLPYLLLCVGKIFTLIVPNTPQPIFSFFFYQITKLIRALPKKDEIALQSFINNFKIEPRVRSFLKAYFFRIQQAGAILFNLGLVSAFILKLISADLAFGWQSTLITESTSLYGFIEKISLLWTWIGVEGPSLDDVAGSKIILKEGLSQLQQSHLSAWWPFLLCSLLFYGLLPRLMLFGFAIKATDHRVHLLFEQQSLAKDIIQRMHTPIVEAPVDAHPEQIGVSKTIQKEPIHIKKKGVILLYPYDLPGDRLGNLDQIIYKYGLEVKERHPFMQDYASNLELAETLSENSERILIIMEASMPPLGEFLSYIRLLTKDNTRPISIALISINDRELSSLIHQKDIKIWQHRIAEIGLEQVRLLPPSFANEGQ